MPIKRLPKHRLYNDAESLFVDGGFTSVAISETLRISETTLSTWRKKYAWDKKREELLASPSKIRELLLAELRSIADGEKPKINADSLSKIQKVFLSFEKQATSIPVSISVFKSFDNWMADNDPPLAVTFTEWHKKYLHYLAQSQSDD